MKKTKMEEIQARRGFFKSASKGAMPVMTLLDVTTSANLFGGQTKINCASFNCQDKCEGHCKTTNKAG
ncbi:MAG: hypothetical protein FWD60_03665 [Candidatus Azobacteroides sp.]|nr:hypothetical protein [Candidatus Azobacteroides sp.]